MFEVVTSEQRIQREREAREAAEALLEDKTRELSEARSHLTALADQLRDQVEQTKAIVESAAEGIITYDQHGSIMLFNRSAQRIFGIPSIVGRDVRSLFEAKETIDSLLFPSNACIVPDSNPVDSDLEIHDSIECIGLRASHIRFAAEIAISRTLYGHTIAFTAVVRDLSKRKSLEARLSQAQKMESVGQLAAGIAHEINTPIQYVGDNLQFLDESFADLAALMSLFEKLSAVVEDYQPAAELLRNIHLQQKLTDIGFVRQEFPIAIRQSREGIERVAKIVRAMKEFSIPSSDTPTAIDINRAVENALVVLASRLQDQIVVRTSLQSGLPHVICLAGQFNQSLLNILNNAIEAIGESCELGEGHIHISTQKIGDSVEIRIADNGPGIPTAVQARIFDPFFTTKEVGKGSGQGLAFVYDVIVNKHRGAVHAVSAPDCGTTFVVSLPLSSRVSSKGREHAVSIG